MIDFIGTYTREELCREWMLRARAAGTLQFLLAKDQNIRFVEVAC
jgi:hypothetical protein